MVKYLSTENDSKQQAVQSSRHHHRSHHHHGIYQNEKGVSNEKCSCTKEASHCNYVCLCNDKKRTTCSPCAGKRSGWRDVDDDQASMERDKASRLWASCAKKSTVKSMKSISGHKVNLFHLPILSSRSLLGASNANNVTRILLVRRKHRVR